MAQRPSYAATAHRESFRHETLRLSENSIRLFQVQAGSPESIISLRITQYSLSKRPPYKAVSYTWGSSTDCHPILVNGRSFNLHPNLWNLLFHLRQRKETAFLWADRMCIDQENLAERNFHVQLMGNIYEKANTVIVWLGLPAPDRTEIRAIEFVKEIAAVRRTRTDSDAAKLYTDPDQQKRWATLLKMCRHPYWTRTWIIQEFLRASSIELLSGRTSLDWQDFDSMMMFVQQSGLKEIGVIPNLLQTRPVRLSLRRHSSQMSNLHDLLLEYHDSMCTERRDKVYGILGLASDCLESPDPASRGVRPDYTKHIVHVYLDALACIDASMKSPESVASAANLIREALMLTAEDFIDYANQSKNTSMDTIYVRPAYVGVIQTTVAWQTTSDLRQRLENLDWGDYVGYEMKSTKMANARRLQTRLSHSSIPEDLVRNVVNAAEIEPELSYLYNYPQIDGLRVTMQHITKDTMAKQYWDNPSLQKPFVILEQPHEELYQGSEAQFGLRLGFACSNARRGDLLLQFSGLNYAVVLRRLGADLIMVGKAVMIRHSEMQEQALDPVCSTSPWYSGCPVVAGSKAMTIESDPLSLAELMSRA